MKNTYKLLVSLLILCFASILHAHWWCTNTRFAAGAAWHQFSSYESFILSPQAPPDFFPGAEVVETDFSLMPYLEGRIRSYLGHHFMINFMAGGGWLRNGTGTIAGYIPIKEQVIFDVVRTAKTSVNLAIVDIGVGYEFFLGSILQASPLVGYLFNREALTLSVFDTSDFFQLKNTWHGPYVGCEGGIFITNYLELSLLYKFLFGHLSSPIITHLAPAVLGNPDGTRSQRSAKILGDIVEFQAKYFISDSWSMGTGLMYLHYRNHKNGAVILDAALTPFISNAKIKQILWQQLMWTFFVEGSY